MTEPTEGNSRKPNPPRPLTAREVLEGFRDLGVDEHRETRLACDPSFNRYTAFWVLGETLDAAYAALEGMSLVSQDLARRVTETMRPGVLGFLAQHWDPRRQRFSTDSSPRTQGIFAFHTAVGVLRGLHQLRSNEPLPMELLERSTRAIGSAPEPVREGLHELIATSREGGGVVENPDRPLIPSLTALYTASSVLWYLQGHEPRDIYRFIEPWRLERFIDGCIKRQRLNDRVIAGFSIHPDHPELCVNTTSFGLRLRKRLGMALDPDLKREIVSFLTLSHRDGGFSSTLWEPRSLNATYLGLRALKMLLEKDRWTSFLSRHGAGIRRFIATCVNPVSGGAPFAPDLSRYGENGLATRYRVQSLLLLGDVLSPESASLTFQFFRGLFNEDTGGFRAYPERRVRADGFDLDELERLLDAKDQLLHEHHQQKLADPSHPPSYLPDSRTLELYDRLADLEAVEDAGEEIRSERETVWRELRKRQRAEAQRFESSFDAGVLGPLRQGHRELDSLERLLTEG